MGLPAQATVRPGARQPDVARECAIRRIDRRLLDEYAPIMADDLLSRIELFWGSHQDFLQAGLGFAVVCGAEIASLCFSGFVTGSTHVIDVQTMASRRRQGYAQAAAQAYLAACEERSLQPYWDCMAENIASTCLAEKLGFRKSHAYTLYSFPLLAGRSPGDD
jgi:RimJ/RimL family protein N-acetyltransferase